jgi:ribosome-associated protein
MTEQIQKLTDTAVKAIKDKKGRGISIIDMQGMDGVICQAFVICQGGSPSQISAIADNVEEVMRKELGEKPIRIVGLENSYWVAMDYVDLMVHIFLPEAHDFYDIESLWQDAVVTEIEDEE